MQVLTVLGRPGAEALLFSRLLAARVRGSVVSVPAAAAAEMAHSTHLGGELSRAVGMQAGTLGEPLPNSLVWPLIQPRLERAARPGESGAIVLHGFPRNLDQLRMLQQAGLRAPTVVHLALDRHEAERRVAERRVCAACGGAMYPLPKAEGASTAVLYAHHAEDATDCDSPDPRQAEADQPAVVHHRLDAYDKYTVPLLERLRGSREVTLHEVDVRVQADEAWAAIEAACGLHDP